MQLPNVPLAHYVVLTKLDSEISMPFNLNFQAQDPAVSQLQLEPGEMLFVLGADGQGNRA